MRHWLWTAAALSAVGVARRLARSAHGARPSGIAEGIIAPLLTNRPYIKNRFFGLTAVGRASLKLTLRQILLGLRLLIFFFSTFYTTRDLQIQPKPNSLLYLC